MKFNRQDLIDDLLNRTAAATRTVSDFKAMDIEKLNYREAPGRWSVLECIEHLNLYGDFYLPEIERSILNNEKDPKAVVFSSGIIGNYFANLMRVDKGKITRMKSPKDKNPEGSGLGVTTLDRFLKQQERLRSLLLQAQGSDLTRARCAISLTRFISLRLGDTFRFFVYHIERHVRQGTLVIESLERETSNAPVTR